MGAIRFSLRSKWALLLAAMAVVPLLVIGLLVVRIQKAGLEGVERSLETSIVDEVQGEITSRLRAVAEATMRSGEMLTSLEIPDPATRVSLARQIVSTNEDLGHVSVFDDQRKWVDAVVNGSTKLQDEDKKFPESLPAGVAGAWVRQSGKKELRYVSPLRLKVGDKEIVWFLVGSVAFERVSAIVRSVSENRFEKLDAREGQKNRILLLDENLSVLAADTDEFKPGESLKNADIFVAANLTPDDIRKPILKSTEFKTREGAEMLGTYRTLPTQRWVVAVRRPLSEAYSTLVASKKAFLQVIAVSALLAALIGFFVAKRTADPILSLVELTRSYGRREFTKKANVRTGDEVEELGNSLGLMADALSNSEKEIERRAAVEAGLSRYLPKEVARAVASGEQSLELGGVRRTVTALFADVVGFTKFAEKAPPERVVEFLNELFSVLSEVVFRHDGMVDKFMGDCVMALFGANQDCEDHSERAAAAAGDMHTFVEASAPAWLEKYGFDVKLGIGLTSGEALVGNLGSKDRMEFTAIGDNINMAARLESMARPGQTLCTEEVVDGCSDAFTFRALGEHPIRGKDKPIAILEVTSE